MRTPLLMVEDDLDLGKSLKRQLESHDYDVLWVKSLSEFAQVNSQSVVAAIVDLNLPDGSGFTIIEKLKVPALIMTALNSPENRLRSAEEGVYDFIPKPFCFRNCIFA